MSVRAGLTFDGIVEATVRVADRGGLAAVSMRNIGRELGVEAMSLYHHVANKEALLDQLADYVFGLIELPVAGAPWRVEMARRARSARAALTRHPWSLSLVESRAPGPNLLRHHDAVVGCLLADGYPVQLAAHAFSLLDAYIYGFVLTEQKLPLSAELPAEEFVAALELPADQYPHLSTLLGHQLAGGDYAFGDEFEPGLDLILDGLEQRLAGEQEA